MVQRKVPNNLSIQNEHVIKPDKFVANMKLSSHQNQDGKSKVSDMKKKMKKSKSVKISDLETLQLQSTPSSVSKRTTTQDGSPNYMKPTSSSHAKKELFSVSLRKTQSSSDFKNFPRKFSSDSKATCKKNPIFLARTLTKTTSFKASRTCPRKTTKSSMFEELNANEPHRATCSSTLKDSKFPSYLMLNHGGTELEGTSVMKVCPYTYCSLNGHHHVDLPPLKTFMSSRRRVLKRVKLEALSPRSPRNRRLKGLGEIEKKDFDVDQNVFDEKIEYDEIGVDFFIDIYANEKKDEKSKGEEEIGNTDFIEDFEDYEDIIKSTIEDDGIAEDFLKKIEDQEKKEDADEDQQTSWSHEEMSMEDVDNNMEDFDSDSEADDMEWEEEQLYGFDHENDADSSVYRDEDNDSKDESLSESSHDMSVTWLDDILSIYYDDIILVDETIKEGKSEESIYLEEQSHDGVSLVLDDKIGSNETQEIGYPTSDIGCDRSSLADEIFDYAEENGEDVEKQVENVAVDEELNDNSQCEKMNEKCNVEETSKENKDNNINRKEKSEIQPSPSGIELCPLRPQDQTLTAELTPDEQRSETQLFDVCEERIKDIQYQGKGNNKRSSCIVDEEENTRENWKGVIRRKRCVEDEDDEMRKFNPKEPNFLPLEPEKEKEKVDLRHQMMDERKNADEWMVDCALRQVVNKLGPARKKKVALLVEAFETVIPKYESHLRKNSGFAHARHIQACS